MNVNCSSETGCPILLDSECVFYEGASLPYTGITTNSTLEAALQSIENVIENIINDGGGTIWGAITGDVEDQTDLIDYLIANYYPLSTNPAGYVTSVTGTPNRISSTGGTTPVINIDVAYDALWQPIDADLTAIAALGFASTSFLKKTALNTWALDTNTYITSGEAWLLASGGLLTGVNTITSNAKNQLIFTGTWTATAANDYHIRISPTITGQGATNPNTYRAVYITPSFTAGDDGQTLTALAVDATFDDNGKSNITQNLLSLRNNTTAVLAVNSLGKLTLNTVGTDSLVVNVTGSGRGMHITSVTGRAIDVQTGSEQSAQNGIIKIRIDSGNGGIIFGNSWLLVPNSNTLANTTLRTDYQIKPGDGGGNILGGYMEYKVYANTAAPSARTGFEWATITSGTSTSVTMRLEGSNLGLNGASTFDTGVGVLAMLNASTSPAAGDANMFLMYSADIVAGNAVPHFNTENGQIIKLYTTNAGSAYNITNGTLDRAYDCNATSTDELADVLFTLIEDLKLTGIIV